MRVSDRSFYRGHVLCPRCGRCAFVHPVRSRVTRFCNLSVGEVYVAARFSGAFEPCDVYVDVMLDRLSVDRLRHDSLEDSLGR
jgi:hypothetical protein